MNPEDFIQFYEAALATQEWNQVEHLIHNEACVTFSTGPSFRGKLEIRKAFEENFATIENEKYTMTNITWITKNSEVAVYIFEFGWTGFIKNQETRGSGCGACILRKENGNWQLLVENLSAHESIGCCSRFLRPVF